MEENQELDKWLTEVSEGCHNIAIRNKEYPDFYVFQSPILLNPELLIVGANPGGNTKYAELLGKRGVDRRDKNDLANETNKYLDSSNWHINKPILEMFSHPTLRQILTDAVIMNAVYFNSTKVSDLKAFKSDGNEMIAYCSQKSKELIYDIIKPKNILFIGMDASRWLDIKYDDITDTVLHDGKKSWLIQKKEINGINHYRIHHTSRNYSFNTGNNLELKKAYLKEALT